MLPGLGTARSRDQRSWTAFWAGVASGFVAALTPVGTGAGAGPELGLGSPAETFEIPSLVTLAERMWQGSGAVAPTVSPSHLLFCSFFYPVLVDFHLRLTRSFSASRMTPGIPATTRQRRGSRRMRYSHSRPMARIHSGARFSRPP